jgi:uncharacterized protein YecE (DUF72 family)
MAELRIGTSAFTAVGWPGSFYPKGMQPRDFLTYYATKFDSVEVDSTFNRTPSRSTVPPWPRFALSFLDMEMPGSVTAGADCDQVFFDIIS